MLAAHKQGCGREPGHGPKTPPGHQGTKKNRRHVAQGLLSSLAAFPSLFGRMLKCRRACPEPVEGAGKRALPYLLPPFLAPWFLGGSCCYAPSNLPGKNRGRELAPPGQRSRKTNYVVGILTTPSISFDVPPWQLRQNCATALPPASGVYCPLMKNMVEKLPLLLL